MSAVLDALIESLEMLERDARSAFDAYSLMTSEQLAAAWQEEEPGPYARYVANLDVAKAALRSGAVR